MQTEVETLLDLPTEFMSGGCHTLTSLVSTCLMLVAQDKCPLSSKQLPTHKDVGDPIFTFTFL